MLLVVNLEREINQNKFSRFQRAFGSFSGVEYDSLYFNL